jgi:hypothetical protein
MAADRRTAIWEVITGAGLAAVGAAFLAEGWDLPDGYFEPMGPRPVPLALAWAILIGSLMLCASGAASLLLGRAKPTAHPGYQELPWAAAGTCAATVIYCVVLSVGVISYWLATAVFLAVSIPFLAERRWKLVMPATIVGIVFGGGLHFLFTKILVTDLP